MSQTQGSLLLADGIAAAKAGDKTKARQLLRRAAAAEPRRETAWLWLAGLAESPLEVIHFLERALAINPSHEKARSAMRTARVRAGVAAAQLGDRARARELLNKAVAHDPTSETAWLWLASVADSPDEAAGFLEKVLAINPANEQARASLERCRTGQPGVPTEDVASKEEAAQQPAAKPVVVQKPASPAEGEDWECPLCLEANDQAQAECPSCGAILSLARPDSFFGRRDVDRGKLNAAVERLEREQPADDPEVAYHLGLAYLNLKHFDSAWEMFQMARELQPDDAVLASRIDALLHQWTAQTKARATSAEQRKAILVIDDSPTIRKLVAMTVERRGFAARTAADAYEAIDVIRERGVPDLILLDITMPGMDGYQLCKLLRENADTANVPIIMISSNDGFFSKVRGRMAGSTDYVTKPFVPEHLMEVVERHCGLDGPTALTEAVSNHG